jgi:hypothetical protein
MGFGSLEAALTTTADVALQIALAGGLGRAGAGAALLMADFLERLYKSTKQSGRNVSKSVLTAMSVNSYNEAIENGYTTSEASVMELWLLLCGKLLNSYILGIMK